MVERQLCNLFKPLRRLRLQMWTRDPDKDGNDDVKAAMVEAQTVILASGGLHKLLSGATELRVLKLSFHPGISSEAYLTYLTMDLKHVFGDLGFPHLYELGLCHCRTSEDYMFDLLLRHKATLRRLCISYSQLSAGTWRSLFQRLGSKLPQLRTIRLCGVLESEELGYEFDFDVPGARASKRIQLVQDAVENYVLGCGEWPDVKGMAWEGEYPWEVEGYKPPGLPELHDRAADDPVYECDWNDDAI